LVSQTLRSRSGRGATRPYTDGEVLEPRRVPGPTARPWPARAGSGERKRSEIYVDSSRARASVCHPGGGLQRVLGVLTLLATTMACGGRTLFPGSSGPVLPRRGGPLGPATSAVTGDVQHQVQGGRDGQADRGPADHIQGVVCPQIHSGDRVQGGQ